MTMGFESAVAGIRAVLQPLAARVLVREQTFGERDVDDHRRRTAHRRFFGRRELTALHHPQTERLEVIRLTV